MSYLLLCLLLLCPHFVLAQNENRYLAREPGRLGGWAAVEVYERPEQLWKIRFLEGVYEGREDLAYPDSLSIMSGCYGGFCVGQRALYRKGVFLVDLVAYHEDLNQWVARMVVNGRYLEGFYSSYEFVAYGGASPGCEAIVANWLSETDQLD